MVHNCVMEQSAEYKKHSSPLLTIFGSLWKGL